MKVNEEAQNSTGGNPLVIELEVNGEILEIEIVCPICKNKLYWLSEDHSLLYCSKCRTALGYRHGDFTFKSDVTWRL